MAGMWGNMGRKEDNKFGRALNQLLRLIDRQPRAPCYSLTLGDQELSGSASLARLDWHMFVFCIVGKPAGRSR